MKKTLWIKSAAIMLAISAICLFDAYAAKGPGGGGMSIYDGEPSEADCRACHDDWENFDSLEASNPDKHHAKYSLCSDPECPYPECHDCCPDCPDCTDCCLNCLDCHTIVLNDVLEANVVSGTDCLGCHDVSEIEGSPGSSNRHHQTVTYDNRDCSVCHTN